MMLLVFLIVIMIMTGLLAGFKHYGSSKYRTIPFKIKSRAPEKIASTRLLGMTIEDAMKRHPLFNFYPRQSIKEILESWDRVKYKNGDIITTPGFILQGCVEIWYGNSLTCIKEKGSFLNGSMELLGYTTRGIKKAKGFVEVLLVDASLARTDVWYILFSMVRKSCIEVACKYFELEGKLVEKETMKIGGDGMSHLDLFLDFLNRKFLQGLDDGKEALKKSIETRFVGKGEVLKDSGEPMDYIVYVVSGEIQVLAGENAFSFGNGSLFGYFSLFFDSYSSIKILAKGDSSILICNSSVLFKLGLDEKRFDHSMLLDIDECLHVIDESVEWIRLSPGDMIVQKGGTSKEIFYIAAGSIKSASKEFSSGMAIGDRECIFGENWGESFVATKITDIVRIPSLLVDYFFENDKTFFKKYTKRLFENGSRKNGKIVSIIPIGQYRDIESFSRRLRAAIGASSLLLNRKDVVDILARRSFDTTEELGFMDYLTKMSKRYEIILIYVENEYSRLLRYLLNFSDILLTVGTTFADIPEYNVYCRIEFVKIYEERKALNERSMRKREKTAPSRTGNANEKETPRQYDRIHHVLFPSKTILFCSKDFQRLARSLLGKRIGLVLGGGGARGLAHIGVIQALEEEGIPIDCVGGTSMGAFIGALYARECNNYYVFKQAKRFSRKMSNIWLLLLDLTYPICSMFSGHGFNRSLHSVFGDSLIQDLWLEYFCITTNISNYEEEVHRNGMIWRYVRASMGLCGYLPPICDNKKLLVDGGYLNNVPADVMMSMQVEKIITVDVGTVLENDYFDYGDTLSGFTILFNRFFGNKKFVTMEEIQYRLAYISTERKTKELQANGNIVMLKPDLGKYRTMDFKKFDEIVACGYQSTKDAISEWKRKGIFDTLFLNLKKQTPKRRYSV
ncbi:patatin-like phospholipase domain containing protein 6 [Encephalitozoon intestinalis ATCC 50506]|uniref:Lysophospholipase NTE1 n=1 Tax=Encephalitozoon intestinalis (strain ATCC 50506) TaxID=876142 RepID=E0S726_ENCIT|nr:patatin-like phospholipase domain containing protein 6 [Encephalitozoon intestinalis ATCC 50506]ADM11454.1 patatin-like phospholipase domain containing protein 6 [Encephalitozoon intestinalis ATCC 50506]UTX45163.1 patatin-like phospholipase [Encephalitozoon intestinalis]